MASSSFNLTKSSNNSSGSYIIGKIEWSSTKNTDGNYSSVTATLYCKKANDSMTLTSATGGSWPYSLTINGSKISGSVSKSILTDWVAIAAHTVQKVSHNADGKKAVSISGSVSAPSGTSYAGLTTSGSKSVDLDTIPRASTISVTSANIGSKPTITISRASSSFTHTVEYAFGSLKGTIATKTTATSITSWTLPEEFYAQIPNAKIGEGTLTCTTYSGNTPIGSNQCKLSVTTDETKCKPTVKGTVVDTNPKTIAVTGNSEILVRYCSTASCTIEVTLNKSAGSVKTKTINNVAVSGNTRDIVNVEVGTFDFYAKDSREYHETDKVVAKAFIPYVMLTANVTAWREAPTDNKAKLRIEGNYFKGNFGAKDNTLTVKYRQNGTEDYIYATPNISDNNTYTLTVDLPDLVYSQSFEYEVVVYDEVNSITKPATVLKGIPVFDWGEDDFNFNVPVTINGVNILEKLAALEKLVKG